MLELSCESVDDVFADPDLLRQLREERAMNVDLASKTHRSLLPSPIRHPRIDVDVRHSPINSLSGDYCQVRFPDPSSCYVTMCHVNGPGVVPALLATRVSSEVRHFISDCLRPIEIVRSLNRFIHKHFRDARISVSFVAAQIDLDHRMIVFSGAGHPPILHLRSSDGSVRRLESRNALVGVKEDCLDDEPERTAKLVAGDRLLFFSHAITEATDAENQELGLDGLEHFASRTLDTELFDMSHRIMEQVAQYRDGPPRHDTTLIVAEIK